MLMEYAHRNEFDKCRFCESYGEFDKDHCCYEGFCMMHNCYRLDVNKILKKADDLSISVTDVLNLICECNDD